METSTRKQRIKVALYTRVSTEDQAREGYSLDSRLGPRPWPGERSRSTRPGFQAPGEWRRNEVEPSLDVQKDYLIDFANRQGLEIHPPDAKNKIYEDDGCSGYSLDRPALNRLLDDAGAKRFNLILVYKLDRFSRRLKDLLNLLDELECRIQLKLVEIFISSILFLFYTPGLMK